MTEASNAPADRSEIEIKSVSVGVSASQSIALARSSTDSLTSWARKVRHMRFLLIRALSCPVPGLSSKTVPLIGGRTGLEIIVCIIIAAAVVAFSLVGDAGSVLAASIFVAVILGLRTNVLEIVFGVSFERALYYHKWFGSLVLAIMVIHILQRGVSTSGIVLIITTVLIGTVYLGKNLNFEFFYYGHIAAYIATAITLLFHGGKLGTFSLIAYAADLVLRYLIRGRKVSAEVEKLPGDVVRLTFPRDFEHEAGGYVFVRIPELSHIEYHPFSISSSALEPNVTIHIRALGDWSSRLLDHAAKHQEEALKAGAGAKLSKTMDLYLEGPYGSASIDLADDAYEVCRVNMYL
jgi:predicted ferric reductase